MDGVTKMTMLNGIPPYFKKFGPQVWYFFVAPIFFLLFCVTFQPKWIVDFLDMGQGLFALNITITALVILVVMVISRLVLYNLRRELKLTWGWFVLWILSELLVCSIGVSVFIYSKNGYPDSFYFILVKTVGMIYSVMAFPFSLITMGVSLYAFVRTPLPSQQQDILVRFPDYSGKVKIVLSSSSILYIQADENYVKINYMDGGQSREYSLRLSMKKMEELLAGNTLVRCHRSYFINPARVSLLRKDKDGLMFAEFHALPGVEIPVSKKYYEGLAGML